MSFTRKKEDSGEETIKAWIRKSEDHSTTEVPQIGKTFTGVNSLVSRYEKQALQNLLFYFSERLRNLKLWCSRWIFTVQLRPSDICWRIGNWLLKVLDQITFLATWLTSTFEILLSTVWNLAFQNWVLLRKSQKRFK